jgi:cytochrome c oxidase cbb3-type subunit I/II
MAETAVQTHNPAEHAQASGPRAGMEAFSYDDAIVRMFVSATVLWGIVAFLAGLFIALQMVVPALNFGVEYLTFGRLRPLHTNAAIFAFAGNAIFAAVYYSTQRLCKTRMWSDTLGRLHFWGWQGIIVAAAVTLPLGITQGKEYAELEWPIDLAIAVVWLGFFGTNFFMTLKVRRERHLYVALWFYIATIVTVTLLHVFNSLSIPVSMTKSYSVYAGVQDALMQWWYGHNAVAFFLTTPFLGLMYYFIPKAAEKPVFSYRLSIVHFWSLVFIYIWAGPHHLHYSAVAQWASTLGMLFSLMLWMPSWGGMFNGLLTLRGAWHKVTADPVLKFFVAGVTFYGMSTFEGPMLSIKSINSLSHFTDWTIAHVHSGALGWNGLMTFGMIYYLAPRLFQAPLWSKRLCTTHFWLATTGIILYILPIYAAGVTQGLMWRAFDQTGRLQYPDFIETVTAILPMYWIRAGGGTLFLVGSLLMAVNFVMTWRGRPAKYEVPVHYAPALTSRYADEPLPASRLGEGNLKIGHALDKAMQGRWHRRWERLPLVFSFMTIFAVVLASVVSNVPMFLVKSNIPTIPSVQPYTPLELAGRDIYIAEGCYNCHSQMVRPIYAETKRYGEYSKPGEFVYDHPFQWGSRRTGPDLQREGGRQSNLWHYTHFQDPRQVSPKSIMPKYSWLLEQETDFAGIQKRVDAMATLGVPYGEAVKLRKAEAMAREQAAQVAKDLELQGGPKAEETQNKKVIALIAYIQRLGVDISKPAPAAEKE